MAQDGNNNQSGANALAAGVIGAALGAAGAAIFMSKDENREKITRTVEDMKARGEEIKAKAQDTLGEAKSRAASAMEAAKGKAVEVIDETEKTVSNAAERSRKKLAHQRPTTKGA